MSRLPKYTPITLIAALAVIAHAVCVTVFVRAATPLSYAFLVLSPVLAGVACLLRARDEAPGARAPWYLLAMGTLLWASGMTLSAWEEMYQQLPSTVAWFSDFLYFLYGIPVLLSISSVAAEHRTPMFVWLDGLQAVMTGYLTYIAIFSVAPFSDTAVAPISETTLVLTYNIENLALAIVATLRLVAQPRGKDRRFYEVLCGFLWFYAVCAYFYNRWAIANDGHGLMDLVVNVPFALLAAATSAWPAQHDSAETTPAREQIARVAENGSPVLYTVALLVLSVSLMREHYTAGIVGVFTALVVYAMRTTILQGRLVRTQRELREARDRLETMALTDGLTGAANRRCFDQTLIVEWNRAIRHREPLSLLLADIDFFKQLNDRYGHPAGDRCLVALASALQSAMPEGRALLARYGGEEFAAILPATGTEAAFHVARAMQAAVRALGIENETVTGRHVTISIGVAIFDAPETRAPHELVDAADAALYRAKYDGRDRIETLAQADFVKRSNGRDAESGVERRRAISNV